MRSIGTVAAALALCLGCARVIGADDYRVAERDEDGSTKAPAPTCDSPVEAPNESGECVEIGARCGELLEPDGEGGCIGVAGEDCEWRTTVGVPTCDPMPGMDNC